MNKGWFSGSPWNKGLTIKTDKRVARGIQTRVDRKKNEKFYKNKNWLYQKYWEEKLLISQIAELCKVHVGTIQYWMKKFSINHRTMGEVVKIVQNHFEVKKKNSERMQGNKNPMYGIRLIGEKNPNWGKIPSEDTRKKIGEANKIIHNRPEVIKKNSEAARKQWRDPDYVKKWFKGHDIKPNKLEKFFDEMTPDLVRYVGNKAWFKMIDGKYKNPDFKITGQNKVIEIFGDYWHRNSNPQEIINLYAKGNLDCLIFWEHEIYNNQEEVLRKVNKFIGL